MLHLKTFSLWSHYYRIIYWIVLVWGKIRRTKTSIGCGKTLIVFISLRRSVQTLQKKTCLAQNDFSIPRGKICQIRCASIEARAIPPWLRTSLSYQCSSPCRVTGVWPACSAPVTDCTSCQLELLRSHMSAHLLSPPPHYPLLRVMTHETLHRVCHVSGVSRAK